MEFILGFILGAALTLIIVFFVNKTLFKAIKSDVQDTVSTQSVKSLEESQRSLDLILAPLKEKLKDYQEKVQEIHQKDEKERFSLQKQIDQLLHSNRAMEIETQKLSKVLKGDVKAQGQWGELVLEKVLEGSGLRSQNEYSTQMTLKSNDGASFRPDAVVMLPNDSHLIIDSKVSLKHYTDYLEAEDSQKESKLKEIRKSLQTHIDGLAKKDYQDLEGIQTPGFIFMFIPVESVYVLMMHEFQELLQYAWNKKIILVSPSTLMANLKTVASLWQIEKQSKNAQEIAKKAGLMYDKFVLFGQDLQKLGEGIERNQKTYAAIMNKLETGKGNLINRADELRELGAKSTKSLN